jgi:hypothetical protein
MNKPLPVPAFTGSLADALAHVARIMPGAPLRLRLNVDELDLLQPVTLSVPNYPSNLLEISGTVAGIPDAHAGFVTVHGLAAWRWAQPTQPYRPHRSDVYAKG